MLVLVLVGRRIVIVALFSLLKTPLTLVRLSHVKYSCRREVLDLTTI